MKTKKKLRILGAEDDDFQKMALEMVIGQTGLGSDIFCNGKKAVMAFIKNPKQYHLILLDLNMPIMDGFTAAKHIRKRNKKIKILALSAGQFSFF